MSQEKNQNKIEFLLECLIGLVEFLGSIIEGISG